MNDLESRLTAVMARKASEADVSIDSRFRRGDVSTVAVQPVHALTRTNHRAHESRGESSMRTLSGSRARLRSPWVAVLVAVATVVVIVVGLVAIGSTGSGGPAGSDPGRLRWLIRNLPDGWKAISAEDPGDPTLNLTPANLDNVYATTAAPAGPILVVSGSEGRADAKIVPGTSAAEKNYRELIIDGRRAAFADGSDGQDGERVLYIETNSQWIRLTSRNIDDAALTTMAQSAIRNDDGTAAIPPADLTVGLELVTPAGSQSLPAAFPTGNSMSTYGLATDDTKLTLMIGHPDASGRAFVEMLSNPHHVSVGTFVGFSGSFLVYRVLYWERGGVGFYLLGQGMTEPQMVDAASSIQPATTREWEDLVLAGQAGSVAQVAPPTGTDPPTASTASTSEIRDVAVDVSVNDLSDNSQTWSGTLPTGEHWTLDLSRVYNTFSFAGTVDGQSSGVSGFVVDSTDGATTFQGFDGGAVITADRRATAMRVVRSNGDRYTIPLHDVPGASALRVGVLGLPGTSPERRIELIDADNNVLASYVDGVTSDADGNVVQLRP